MENEQMQVNWATLRAVLMETAGTKDLLDHLLKKQPLTTNEIMLLNLLMQEATNRESIEITARYTDQMANASNTAASAAKATSDSTHALKNATKWLAGATIILAISAVADIVLRVLCGE